MANLPESSAFDAGVYQLELTDPVIGGPSGVSNAPLKNLANRTKYLKDHVDAIEAAYAPKNSPAFTGTPTAPTPAQFSNNTALATTEFVQRAMGNANGFDSIYANTQLNASHFGKVISTGSPGGFVLTLPVPTIANSGSAIRVSHMGSGAVTLRCPSGTDFTNIGKTEITISYGEFVTVYGDGVDGYWVDGNAALESLSTFASSIAESGLQKLPGGLIIQ